MRAHRLIGNFDFSKPLVEIRDPRIIRRLTKKLRLKPGATVTLSDGNGREFNADIKKMDAHALYLMVRSERATNAPEKNAYVILCIAILAREHFEAIVEKATEIGVSEIIPLITDRTIKKNIQKERALTIAREASEKSGRRVLPVLQNPMRFDTYAEEIPPKSNVLFCDPEGNEHITSTSETDTPVYVFIGPEGGWTRREREAAKKRRWRIVRFGNTTLRAETTAIIATYIALRSQDR